MRVASTSTEKRDNEPIFFLLDYNYSFKVLSFADKPCESKRKEINMNQVARLLTLDQDSQEIRDSQTAIANLLDKEAQAKEIFADLPAHESLEERLNRAAQLYSDCSDTVDLCKELEGVLKRVRGRMEGVQALVYEGIEDEVPGDKFETEDWKFNIKENPPKVIVDDLAVVARKYRNEPKPIPPWEEWAVDKNAVKQALIKEKVQSIHGVHLEVSERVEIKPR